MVDKEFIVYVVDLGELMVDCYNGCVEFDFDFGMCYVWDKILDIVVISRKMWIIGFVGFNIDEIENEFVDKDKFEGYDNIFVL